MKTFIIIMLLFGLFETVSNLFHLSKGSKAGIGESARRQHRELPLDADTRHFYYKALLMLAIGILFLLSSLLFLSGNRPAGECFTFINTLIMSLYGLVQLIVYHRTFKVWTSFIVYSLPLTAFLLLQN